MGYVTAFLQAATIGSMPSVMNISLSRGSSPPDKVRLLVRFILFFILEGAYGLCFCSVVIVDL